MTVLVASFAVFLLAIIIFHLTSSAPVDVEMITLKETVAQLKLDVKMLKATVGDVKHGGTVSREVRSGFVTRCRVCFQETEGSSQCQGTRASCSGWSDEAWWTAPFRDDTDNRDGGCTYQWMIQCQ